MERKNLKEELSKKYGNNFLAGRDWYLGCGERHLNKMTIKEARSELLALFFLERKEVNYDQTTKSFWHNFLQTHPRERAEFAKSMLSDLRLGMSNIVDLRVEFPEGNLSSYFNKRGKIKITLVQDDGGIEKDDYNGGYNSSEKPFHYETVLWEGEIKSCLDHYDVPTLPDFNFNRIYTKEGVETIVNHNWYHGVDWLSLQERLIGKGELLKQRERELFQNLSSVGQHLGQLLFKRDGKYFCLSADRYFDETGKLYSPESIYGLRLFFELEPDEKIEVIEGWETKDTKRGINTCSLSCPIVNVPAYNFKWNDDIIIHSSFLEGAKTGIKEMVLDMV